MLLLVGDRKRQERDERNRAEQDFLDEFVRHGNVENRAQYTIIGSTSSAASVVATARAPGIPRGRECTEEGECRRNRTRSDRGEEVEPAERDAAGERAKGTARMGLGCRR